MQVYLVGGAVRDELLNRPVSERDWVVVGATAEEMLKAGYIQVGKDFPVFLHPETKEEYALARTERKSGRGYTGFTVFADPTVTLEEDLARRDLTVNAMARSGDNELVDPFNGKSDLDARILRHVSPAFVEDPLRVLRVARFAARYASYGFSIAQSTLQLMSDLSASGELSELVPERVWQETVKALKENTPSVYFQTLHDCGALEIVFPELEKLFGVPQRKEFHPEVDTGVHTMMVLDQSAKLTDDLEVRFAALLHDLGKGETPEEMLPRHHGHEQKGIRPLRNLCSRMKVPNSFRDIALIVTQYHGHALRAFELKPTTLVEMFEAMDAFRKPERVEQYILASEADYRGRPGYEDENYPQADYLRKVFEIAQGVSAKRFIDEGLLGKEVGLAVKRARAQAIASFKLSLDESEQKFK